MGIKISKVGDPEASTDKAEQTNGAKDAGDEEGKANVQAGGSASKKEVTGDLSKKLKEQEEEKPEPTVAFLTLFRRELAAQHCGRGQRKRPEDAMTRAALCQAPLPPLCRVARLMPPPSGVCSSLTPPRSVATKSHAQLANLLGSLFNGLAKVPPDISAINQLSLDFVIVGISLLVCSWLQVGMMKSVAHLLQCISDDCFMIQRGVGEKMGQFVSSVAMCITGLALAFYYGWSMTLVMLSLVPVMFIVGAVAAVFFSYHTMKSDESLAVSRAYAQQVVANVRTVHSCTAEERAIIRYNELLEAPERVRASAACSFGQLVAYSMFALAMWFGGKLVLNGTFSSGGQTFQVLGSALIGGTSLGNITSTLQQDIKRSQISGACVFAVINREPAMDKEAGDEVPDEHSSVELRNVHFRYPSAPDIPVLNGMSLVIPPRTSCALVGGSGSGKSTVVGLLLRFYDPGTGVVLLNDRSLRQWNLRSLRHHVGLVSQEPVLFATTIATNIGYGQEATSSLPLDPVALPPQEDEPMDGAPPDPDAVSPAQISPHLTAKLSGKGLGPLLPPPISKRAMTYSSQRSLVLSSTTRSKHLEPSQVELELQWAMPMDSPVSCYYTGISTLGVAVENVISVQFGSNKSSKGKGKADEEEVEMGSGKPEPDDEPANVPMTRMYKILARWKWVLLLGIAGSALLGGTLPGVGITLSLMVNTLSVGCTQYVLVEATLQASNAYLQTFAGSESMIAAQSYTGCVQFADGAYLVPPASGQEVPDCPCNPSFSDDITKYALIFFAVAVAAFVGAWSSAWGFGFLGQKLACEVGWFDRDENNSAAIMNRLSFDALAVKGQAADSISMVVQSLATAIAGLVIAFYYSWKMTLVVLSCTPLLMFSGYMVGVVAANTHKLDDTYNTANVTASEGMSNVRVVASLTLEERLQSLYEHQVNPGVRKLIKLAMLEGLGNGTDHFIIFASYGLAFWYGGQLLDKGELDAKVPDLSLAWLRAQIGLVGQEPVLFNGTITENIKFGAPNASDEEVQAAAKAANAHDFIQFLEKGYDTQIGEQHSQLSGGQKQRVAIARAILRNPKAREAARILLLDEATSALDAEAEQLAALDKLVVGRTTIMVAHRPEKSCLQLATRPEREWRAPALSCAPATHGGQSLAAAAVVRAWRERTAWAAARRQHALQLAVQRRRFTAPVAAASDGEADGPEQQSGSNKRRYTPRGSVPDAEQDPRVMAELQDRVGIASLSEVFHSGQPGMRAAPLLESEAVRALLDYVLVELGLPKETVHKLLTRAPELLGVPGRAQALFGGLAEFGVAAADTAQGLIKLRTTATRIDWAGYRPSAALPDRLMQGRGGLAALMANEPSSCMATFVPPASSLKQGLEWLQGRQLATDPAGREPLLALSNEQVERLVWQQPTSLTLVIENLRPKAALLHEVLGATTEEASRIVSSGTRYLTLEEEDRRKLLQWLVGFYGSQQLARRAVCKEPGLTSQQVDTLQENVAALRRRLAEEQQRSEDWLDAKVLDVCTRQPTALHTNIDSPLMAAKLEVLAAAGFPPAVALGQYFVYLKSALRKLAVRLTFVATRTQQPAKLCLVNKATAGYVCMGHGLSVEDFLAYEQSYLKSPEWLELCARHGLDDEGRAPRSPRRKRSQQ
eukprot:scaffold16.g87.t1